MDLRLVMPSMVLAAALGAGCHERDGVARLPADEVAGATPILAFGTTPSEPEAAAAGAPEPAAARAVEGGGFAPVLSGNLEPHRRSTLMPKVGGWIARVYVEEGNLVQQGAPLVTVEQEKYRLAVRQAEAAREGARVALHTVRLEYDRNRALLVDKTVPRGQFDAVEARYKGALAQLKLADVSLQVARKSLQDTTIYAPYTGVIVKKHVCEGDNAAAFPPTPLVTIEETALLDLRVKVPASFLGWARAGQEVLIHFPAGPPDRTARISHIVPTLDPGTRTFSVIVEIDNAAGTLRPGLFAEVRPARDAAPPR